MCVNRVVFGPDARRGALEAEAAARAMIERLNNPTPEERARRDEIMAGFARSWIAEALFGWLRL